MNRSRQFGLKNQRQAFRLLMECRDLGHDPAVWQHHMFEGLCRLTGAKVGIGGEMRNPDRTDRQVVATVAAGHADEDERRHARRYVDEGGIRSDPLFRVFFGLRGRLVTRRLEQLVRPDDWHASDTFQRYMRPARLDARIISFCRFPDTPGLASGITLHRPPDDKPFSPRDVRLVHLFHHELGRLLGRSLASFATACDEHLPPRLRQVLQCLLHGDGEKQVAARLGISRHTVHTYINRLHRRFDVQSRGELLARCRHLPGVA